MRARGFTLIELLVVITVLGAVLFTATGLVASFRATERASAAYVRDLVDLRRAVERLEGDLREAADLEGFAWRLEGDVLRRGDEPIARNVSAFDLRREGSLARARLTLGARDRRPARSDPTVTLEVRMRNAAGRAR